MINIMQFIHCSNMYGLNMFIKLVLKNIQKHFQTISLIAKTIIKHNTYKQFFNRLNLLKNSKPEYYLM